MQDINPVIHFPVDDLHCVENIMNQEEERYLYQYEDEEPGSNVSSDKDEIVDLTYCEEASCKDNGETCCSSQEEDCDSTYVSSCESDADWEEERNDGSEYSYVSKGMNSFLKSESEFLVQNCANQFEVESGEEELSTQYEDKRIIYKDELVSCVDECLEDTCSSNQQYRNDFEVNASAPKDDLFARHLNHLDRDYANNIDSYFACFVDGVNGLSSGDGSNFSSSYVESVHDSDVRNGFKVYTNPLHGEEFDVDQYITCPSVYKGALHGVINPLFEEHMEVSDLAKNKFNDDTLSYYCKRSDCSSSKYDNEYDHDIASGYDNKVFDETVIENLPIPCNVFYDEYFNVMTNPLADFKESFEDPGLVLDSDVDDICEYRSDCSFDSYPIIQKDTHFECMSGLFPQVEYEAFIFENDSMHEPLNEESFQFQSDMFKHADQYFHNELMVEDEVSYMHYESKSDDFVLPCDLLYDDNMIGETDMSGNFSLPHESSDENYVYDRGKQFFSSSVAQGHRVYIILVAVVVSIFSIKLFRRVFEVHVCGLPLLEI